MDSKDYIVIEDIYGAHNYHPLDVVITKAKGIWMWDVEGNKYLDFLSAYSAVNQGHCHPRIIKALQNQAKKLTLTSRAFRNDQWPLLAKELCELTGFNMVLPMNSGAEAVETAIKLARKWAYQKKGVPQDEAEIIACTNNFHGRTVTIISFSTEPLYRQDFGPFTPGFKIVPFGDAEALEEAITPRTAAFLVEPIQAEAGILIPPDGYLKKAKEICEKNNVLFIADEIQTGLGRVGKMFACEYEGVKPDVMVIGKSLGGGCYAISAVLSTIEIMGLFKPGEHGSTFGGNPLACAVAREALRVIQDEHLVEQAAEKGTYFLEKLKTIKSRHIKEIRGRGLLIGIELYPEAGGARRFCEALMNERLLCKETHENVIRFAPPLIISKRELDWAFKKIKKVFKRLN
ncbi:MAG TPA: ornithine--oxo-acid transaminase [Candidatus Saccharicenans sp.]|jgi:ornithine--oxo-acid transaminase|nr:ornithine--oxo-acid transaminase [Candidatus Saccharicenans sp.]HQH60265.1 ornithine--oxo-acid transaminase [Candidatus Saccharicenans sp.]HQI21644.1 ornithine--oxo-acid transaminase [Candidatus Saccharicenans sp.]HQM74624.1 ornithine--oxo-acid transaminase [Candidatus Saccharicenans sp.]HRT24932.1 ornithine--oxo-acid transaminase [Candidatus Saccharicenans sp.]